MGCWRSVVWAGVLGLATAPLAAQPADGGEVAASEEGASDVEARRRFLAGQALVEAGQLEAAHLEFQRGYVYSRRALFLFNMAECSVQLQNTADARREYAEYLRREPAGDFRERAEAELARLGPGDRSSPDFVAALESGESATAEAVGDDLDSEARTRFEAGEYAYAAGRFEDALADFRRAHALSGRDELLYNVGLAAERLRRDGEAIEAFVRFVELFPEHPRAEQVRSRIAMLEEQERLRVRSVSPPDENLRPVQPAPSRLGPVLLLVGGAAASVAGGVVLAIGISNRNEIEDLQEPRPWNELRGTADAAPRRMGIGAGLLAVGGAAMVASLIWRLATPADEGAQRVTLSPSGVRVTF